MVALELPSGDWQLESVYMARLRRGELARGIEALAHRARANARRRLEIWGEIGRSERPTSHVLTHFLSIEALSKWSDLELGIVPISPKTLRKYIELEYDGGLAMFTRELKALQTKEVHDAKARSVKAPSHQDELRAAADAVMDMTARYLDLLERIKRISRHDAQIESELMRHFKRFEPGAAHLTLVP